MRIDFRNILRTDDDLEDFDEDDLESNINNDPQRFSFYSNIASNYINLENIIELNLSSFLFHYFIIVQIMLLIQKVLNIYQLHYNTILLY